MLHNQITSKVTVLSTGYTEGKVILDDGEEMLPPGYYMEVDVDGETFAIPIDEKAYQGIHNAIQSTADIASEFTEIINAG